MRVIFLRYFIVVFALFLTFSSSSAMYVTPTQVSIDRGSNSSFDVVSSINFTFHTISTNSDQISYISKRNLTHIHIDFTIPSIIEILRIYEITVNTYDRSSYPLENATFEFFIGDLSDKELFSILERYRDVHENFTFFENKSENLQDTLDNIPVPEPSFWEKYFDIIFTISMTSLGLVGYFGVNRLHAQHVYKEGILKEKARKKTLKNNNAKLISTKQAYSYDMGVSQEAPTKEGTVQIDILDPDELELTEDFTWRRSLKFFTKPTKKDIAEFKAKKPGKDPKKHITSIDIIKKRMKAKKLDKFKKWQLMSAIVSYCDYFGIGLPNREKHEKALLNCTIDDLKRYLGECASKKNEYLKNIVDKEQKETTPLEAEMDNVQKVVLEEIDGDITRRATLEQTIRDYKTQ